MEAPPSDNVWIGDLPPDTSQEQLQAVFGAYGKIVSARVNTPQQGRKTSALVRYSSVVEATWIVQNLSGNIAQGLAEPVIVKFANQSNKQNGVQFGMQPGTQPGMQPGTQPGMQPDITPAAALGQAQPDQSHGKSNVWIGDLPEDFTQDQCSQIFGAYGSISQCRVMFPSQPGRKASALVRFAFPNEASWVVENLNGNVAEGLPGPVIAKFANEPGSQQLSKPAFSQISQGTLVASSNRFQPYDGGKGKFKGGCSNGGCSNGEAPGSIAWLYSAVKGAGILGGGILPNECQVHVSNIPTDTTDLDLMKLFSTFGPLAPMKNVAMLNPDGTCSGVGFIDFVDPQAAQAACLALDNFPLPDGTLLGVSLKKGKKGGGKGGNFDGKGQHSLTFGGKGGDGGDSWSNGAANGSDSGKPWSGQTGSKGGDGGKAWGARLWGKGK